MTATISGQRPVSRLRVRLARLLLALAMLSLLFAAGIGISWMQDRQRLREAATAATASARTEQERLTRLLDWVYHNQGFAKNSGYFIWKRLDATPVQVLERGGDCEDKSKLFAAMLRELGIRSTLAMLYPCRTCNPVHTVAVVETTKGWTPMDSVYNITFPDGRGGFTPIEVLRHNPSILPTRLDMLVAERGRKDKIALYKRDLETYGLVTTVNWDKNVLTRAVAGMIRAMGGEPWRTPRPLFLDDPKQFFMLLGLGAAAGFGLLAWLFGRRGGIGRA